MNLRRILGKIALAFSVVNHRVTGGPVFRLDGLALDKARGRQCQLSSDPHPQRLA